MSRRPSARSGLRRNQPAHSGVSDSSLQDGEEINVLEGAPSRILAFISSKCTPSGITPSPVGQRHRNRKFTARAWTASPTPARARRPEGGQHEGSLSHEGRRLVGARETTLRPQASTSSAKGRKGGKGVDERKRGQRAGSSVSFRNIGERKINLGGECLHGDETWRKHTGALEEGLRF